MVFIKPILTSIHLQNLQSWGDLTIELSAGLNVLIAENQTGKSVVFKVIRLCVAPDSLTPREKEDIPRIGHPQGVAWFSFSDGVTYKVTITATLLQYFIINHNDGDDAVLVSQQHPTEDFLDRMGSTIRGSIISNLLEMSETQFLVNSKTSENANMLEILINHPDLIKIIEVLTNDRIPKTKEFLQIVRSTLKTYKSGVENMEFHPTTNLKTSIDYAEPIINSLRELSKSFEFFDRVVTVTTPGENLSTSLNLLADLTNATNLLDSVKFTSVIDSRYLQIPAVLKELTVLAYSLDSVQEATGYSRQVALYLNLLEKLTSLNTVFDAVVPVPRIKESIPSRLTLLKELSEFSPQVSPVPSRFEQLREKIGLLNELSSVITRMDEILSFGDVTTKRQELYREILESGGELHAGCPLHGEIIYTGKSCVPYHQ